MVEKIEISARARKTYLEAIGYLEKNFSEKEIRKFVKKIDEDLDRIKLNPFLGEKTGRRPNIYKTIINETITLYYQHKPIKKEILLLVFWNTRQNPKKLKI